MAKNTFVAEVTFNAKRFLETFKIEFFKFKNNKHVKQLGLNFRYQVKTLS